MSGRVLSATTLCATPAASDGHRRVLLSLVVVGLLWPTSARAQQPFATDDAEVTPRGWVHVEAFNEFDWLQASQAPHVQQNTVNMRVNYGLGRGLELDLDSPLIAIFNNTTTSPRRPVGIGDTNFGLKYTLRTERPDARMPALTAAAYLETPTGDKTTGLGSGLTDVWVYGVVQKTLALPLILRVNAGYLFTGNTSTGVVGLTNARGHIATMAGSLNRRITERLTFGGEVSAAVANDAGRDRAQLQALLGSTYALSERLTLEVGLTAGHYAASPRVGVQVGFALDVPK